MRHYPVCVSHDKLLIKHVFRNDHMNVCKLLSGHCQCNRREERLKRARGISISEKDSALSVYTDIPYIVIIWFLNFSRAHGHLTYLPFPQLPLRKCRELCGAAFL